MTADIAQPQSARGTAFAARLLSASAILMAAKLAAAALALGTYWLMAQALPPAAVGMVLTGLSLATIAGTIATLGYPSITTRFHVRYETQRATTARVAFARDTRRHALAASLAATALIVIMVPVLTPSWAPMLTIMAGMIPAIAMLRLNGALAIASSRPLLGYLPDLLGRPLIFAVLLLVTVIGFAGVSAHVPADRVAWLALCAVWTVCVFQAVAIAPLRRDVQTSASGPVALRHARRLRKIWLAAALPLVPSTLIVALMPDLVLLASSTALTAADLAILGVCLKIAFLVGFVIQVTIQIALPDLAQAINNRDLRTLWARSGALILLNSAGVIIATLMAVIFGADILALFGPHYAAGTSLLVWLCALQVLRLPAALAIQILILAGQTRSVFLIMALTLVTLFAAVTSLGLIASLSGTAVAIGVVFAVMSLMSLGLVRPALMDLAARPARASRTGC